MKRFLVTALSLLVAISAMAQSGKVTLSLIDSQTKQGVMGAVVEVYPTATPDKKRYYTSGANGFVSISGLTYGNYTLVATFIGYKDMTKEFRLSGASLALGKLVMSEDAQRIETVVKTVKALRTSQNGDTLSYSAGAFKVSNDADVEGLLKKMPGITITNGSVEAQGETIQKIFVDGKEFFGEDVSTAIKSLPAEAVDKIEVFNKLSDNAEFSGMDDGEGYKAINIVTKENMRQGQFGKMYAGYGYEPKSDDELAKGHKWIVGGNVNFFHGDSRVSLIGLFNNVNQQNFSFEDILGVSGQQGGGGRGRRGAVGQYMVRPQSGIALVNSVGANYSDEWGRKKNVKFQGSLFFNHTDTDNNSRTEKWYESPMPIGYMWQQGVSNTTNYNARFNARLDWKISRNVSLMSRTSFSYQGNNPESTNEGYTIGENADIEGDTDELPHQSLAYTNSYNWSDMNAFRFFEFLQLRTKLGKPGRTLTVDGRFNYQNNERKQRTAANDANGIPYQDTNYQTEYDNYFGEGKSWQDMANSSLLYSPLYQYIHRPSEEYTIRANMTYNEPISQYAQLSLQYRMSYENEMNDKRSFYTDKGWGNQTLNENMSQKYQSGFWTHRIGPGFRFAKNKNTVVLNLSYQRSELDGNIVGSQGDKIDKKYNLFSYFGMANIAFNRENTLRIFLRSWSGNPSVTQLQSIFDVSNPQYISIGNKALNPSFTHNLSAHYNLSKVDKGITFMWMFNAQYQQDYISASTWNNPQGFDLPAKFGDRTIPTDKDGNPYRPKEVTSYENLDGYYWLRTHVSLGVPLTFMKCNLNIMGGVSYNRVPNAYYLGKTSEEFFENMFNTDKPDSERFTTNYANNIGYDAGVTLGSNISENIDFTVSWRGTYNQAWNTIGQTAKNNYFNHSVNGNVKWTFLKRMTLTAAVSYVQYIGYTNKYNEDYVLCNVYLGCKVFKNKRGEVQIGVNDIFDQNTSFVRSTGSGYTQNAWNSCIGRYFSVQFVYNLRHFGKRGSTKMSDYGYRESKGSVGVNRGTSSGGWWGPRR
ncbi:MAG: outer membrane beta-barrel protein [Alistipes sp.]|nr:outer membrane beta-barrel protein [Alistipes sp.]